MGFRPHAPFTSGEARWLGVRVNGGVPDRARTSAKTRRWRETLRLEAAVAACHMRGRTAEKNLREQELLANRLKQLEKAARSV